MTNYTIWKLIQQYVTGNCSPEGKEKLERWMRQDLANEQLVREVGEIWELSPPEEFDVNVQGAWKEFHDREIGGRELRLVRDHEVQRPPRTLMHLFRAAAVILVSVFAGYFTHAQLINQRMADTEQPSDFYLMQELVTNNTEKASITFSDGTTVVLNAASSLRFPSQFSGSTREIHLDGEAFFSVAHNPSRPFIVHTEDATIQVLGTRFNVQAWSEDVQADVVVSEGKVAVRSSQELTDSIEVVLTRGEYTRVERGRNPTTPKRTDPDKYLLWTAGGLYFDNTPLKQVLRHVERRFEASLTIEDEELLEVPFTSTFYQADLDEVLKVIAASMELEYVREGSNIHFSRADR